MKLEDIFSKYPYFRLSTPDDSQSILDFFNSITMDMKSFSLRYDRGNNFFDFTKEQGEKNYTFVMEDENKNIRGTASITIINHILNGEIVKLGYLGDLRISPLLSAKIRLQWKKCYSDIIDNFHKLEEFTNVKYLYSAILEENQNAMRSLLKNNDKIIYHELTQYETYNIYLRKLTHTKSKYKILPSTKNDFHHFISEVSTQKGMQDYFKENSDDEFNRRLNTWSNFSEENLFKVIDQDGQTIASVASWEPTSKKLVIEKMSPLYKILGQLLPLFGIPKMQTHQSINVLYLTHLKFSPNASSEDIQNIIESIVDYFLKRKNRKFHTISFFAFPEFKLSSLPFYYEKTPAKFYQVMSKIDFENKNFINLSKLPPAFEIGTA